MDSLIHYVLLDQLLLEPEALRPLCGAWQGGHDWSTKRSVATCPRCRDLLEAEAGDRPASGPRELATGTAGQPVP